MNSLELALANESATIALGSALALAFIECYRTMPAVNLCVHLHGDLGAGKSTLVRALLRGLGVKGKIKSPTYALIEPYDSAYGLLLHLDLYRLTEPGELEYLGVDSLMSEAKLVLIEWPSKAGALLPAPDLSITLSHYENAPTGDGASDLPGRKLHMAALSASGNLLLPKLVAFF